MLKIAFSFDCTLPIGCSIQPQKYLINQYTFEKTLFNNDYRTIKCYPSTSFQFRFVENNYMIKSRLCYINWISSESIIFKWAKNDKKTILDKTFNFPKMLFYLGYFYWAFEVYFVNLNGFDITLSDSNRSIIENNSKISFLACITCKINFYTNGKLIKSCQDILDSNSTVLSIFQTKLNNFKHVALYNSEFPTDLCPLVFKNSNIDRFYLNS